MGLNLKQIKHALAAASAQRTWGEAASECAYTLEKIRAILRDEHLDESGRLRKIEQILCIHDYLQEEERQYFVR